MNFASSFPRTSNRIIACFLKITRADGSVDYSVMTEPDWLRLKSYSDKQNTYIDRSTGQPVTRPNQLYNVGGQIDTGFLMAKCIKHAFKSYPKLKIGRGSALETETVDEQQNNDFDPYAGVEQAAEAPMREESFADGPDMSKGVRIDPAAQNNDDDTF